MKYFWKKDWQPKGAKGIPSSALVGLIDSRLNAYMDQHPDTIIVLNRVGIIIRVNRRFEVVLGYSRAEVEHQLVYDCPFVPFAFIPEWMALHQRALDGETITGIETTLIAKDGRTLDIVLNVRPLFHGEDGLESWSAEGRDITWQRDRS